MSWNKTLVRTKAIPTGLSLIEQAYLWIFLNDMVLGSGEFTAAHDGKIYFFVASRDKPKFRYRAFAQATKLFLKSKRQR